MTVLRAVNLDIGKMTIKFKGVEHQLGQTVTQPDHFLDQIDALDKEITDYYSSVRTQLFDMNATFERIEDEAFLKNKNLITFQIRNMSATVNEIKSTLATHNQSTCIVELSHSLDQIIELSGYAFSNCFLTVNGTMADFPHLVLQQSIDEQTLKLFDIFWNALNERNVFTEAESIISDAQEKLKTLKEEITDILFQVKVSFDAYMNDWNDGIVRMQECFSDIDTSIRSATNTVKANIPVCSSKDVSVKIDPRIFFLQIET